MAIAKMKKLSAIGLVSQRDDLMEKLMTLGVVEITSQEKKLEDSQWQAMVSRDADEKTVSEYDRQIAKVSQALEIIAKHGTGKKPLIYTKSLVSEDDFRIALDEREQMEAKAAQIHILAAQHGEVVNAINKTEALRLALEPWSACPWPLEQQETKTTDIILGVMPAAMDALSLQKDLEEKIPESLGKLIHSDPEQHYLYMIAMKEHQDSMAEIFRSYGFSRVQFEGLKGTVKENLANLKQELGKLAAQKEEIEEDIRSYEADKGKLELLWDQLSMLRDKAAIRQNLLVTQKTFYLQGWLPERAAEKVSTLLEEAGCYFQIDDPQKGEETPVLLLNGRFSMPFEAITKLYALPDSRAIDATPFFSLSFAIFFGMMLGDAAYGIIMALITAFILKKYRLQGMTYQMVKMFFYCGLSTFFWGAMFGGWFGDIVTVVGKTFFNAELAIPPLWFNPMDDPMKLLLFCFLLGGIHLFIGMGLNAWMSIKDGRPLDALFDVGLWYLLLIGVTLLLIGIAPQLSMWVSILSAAGILLTAGRDKKGIGRLISGLGSLYGITGYLSDVLSYSRLLALGLASSVIASVVNIMGSLGGGGFKGLLLMTVAFMIGHTYNFAINALGSFVHSCRLEYVEFFGKFYVGGGKAFQPFGEKTKYVEVLREEK